MRLWRKRKNKPGAVAAWQMLFLWQGLVAGPLLFCFSGISGEGEVKAKSAV